jgi:hypothetical protein
MCRDLRGINCFCESRNLVFVLCTVYISCYIRECVNKSSSITFIVNCMLLAFMVSMIVEYVETFEELTELVNPGI